MISAEEKVKYLRNVSSFAKLADEQISVLAALCKEKTFSQGECIFRQGEVGGVLYIVLSGKVAIEREIEESTDSVSIMIVQPFMSIGEMSLFLDAPNSVTATALEDTNTLWMDNDDFVAFARQQSDLLIELCEVLSRRLFEAYDKIAEVTRDRKPRELRKLYDKLDF